MMSAFVISFWMAYDGDGEVAGADGVGGAAGVAGAAGAGGVAGAK